MNFNIKTHDLKKALNVVQKGIGASRILPITEYIKVEIEGGSLYITSTDSNNFITYRLDNVQGLDGTALVRGKDLVNLVNKTTKESISFKLKESHLEIKGNGTYKLELLAGEYPSVTVGKVETKKIDLNKLKEVFQVGSASIAKEMLMPCLTGYFLGNICVTTDGIKMSVVEEEIFSEPILVTQKMAELVQTMECDEVIIKKDGNLLELSSANITVVGPMLNGIEGYPNVMTLKKTKYDQSVVIAKKPLLESLGRMQIFTTRFENHGVILKFTQDGLLLNDIVRSSEELVHYKEQIVNEEVEIAVNNEYLQSLLKVIPNEDVIIEFESGDSPLRLVDGKVLLVVSPMKV